jgi:1-acyl-sn-glycerol-3-phosphate acyltransferase
MSSETNSTTRPQWRPMRSILRRFARLAFGVLADIHVEGRENLPKHGPLLLVANHFHFTDPALMLSLVPWHLDFIGGFHMPNAPKFVTWIPRLWGVIPVRRGTATTDALRAAERVLAGGGVLGIFPEGGNWATVLRPARPGAAFLAVRTGAQLVPMGFDGLTDLFPGLKRGRRGRITVRIGKPFGPFANVGKGRERRQHLDEIGHEMMHRIAELIPPERRGHYSDDPAIRAAAAGTEVFPWDENPDI